MYEDDRCKDTQREPSLLTAVMVLSSVTYPGRSITEDDKGTLSKENNPWETSETPDRALGDNRNYNLRSVSDAGHELGDIFDDSDASFVTSSPWTRKRSFIDQSIPSIRVTHSLSESGENEATLRSAIAGNRANYMRVILEALRTPKKPRASVKSGSTLDAHVGKKPADGEDDNNIVNSLGVGTERMIEHLCSGTDGVTRTNSECVQRVDDPLKNVRWDVIASPKKNLGHGDLCVVNDLTHLKTGTKSLDTLSIASDSTLGGCSSATANLHTSTSPSDQDMRRVVDSDRFQVNGDHTMTYNESQDPGDSFPRPRAISALNGGAEKSFGFFGDLTPSQIGRLSQTHTSRPPQALTLTPTTLTDPPRPLLLPVRYSPARKSFLMNLVPDSARPRRSDAVGKGSNNVLVPAKATNIQIPDPSVYPMSPQPWAHPCTVLGVHFGLEQARMNHKTGYVHDWPTETTNQTVVDKEDRSYRAQTYGILVIILSALLSPFRMVWYASS